MASQPSNSTPNVTSPPISQQSSMAPVLQQSSAVPAVAPVVPAVKPLASPSPTPKPMVTSPKPISQQLSTAVAVAPVIPAVKPLATNSQPISSEPNVTAPPVVPQKSTVGPVVAPTVAPVLPAKPLVTNSQPITSKSVVNTPAVAVKPTFSSTSPQIPPQSSTTPTVAPVLSSQSLPTPLKPISSEPNVTAPPVVPQKSTVGPVIASTVAPVLPAKPLVTNSQTITSKPVVNTPAVPVKPTFPSTSPQIRPQSSTTPTVAPVLLSQSLPTSLKPISNSKPNVTAPPVSPKLPPQSSPAPTLTPVATIASKPDVTSPSIGQTATSGTASAQVIPTVVLTQQKVSESTDKKLSDSIGPIVTDLLAVNNDLATAGCDDGRRVTAKPSSLMVIDNTNSTPVSVQPVVSPTKSSAIVTANTMSTANGRAAAAALLAPLANKSKAAQQQQPIVAHKRSPSSPVPPGLMMSTAGTVSNAVNTSLVRATKSQPTPILKAAFLAAQESRAEANNTSAAVVAKSEAKPSPPPTPPQQRASKRKPPTDPKTPTDKASPRPQRTPPKVATPAVAAATAKTENGREPRSSQRVRLQYQPFQSPKPIETLPLLYRTKTSVGSVGSASKTVAKDDDNDKVIIYNKNEFLAVRNETNSFFICRAKQNVYKKSHKFKILWFNNTDTKRPNLYTADFYDVTDFECILTNLTMDRLDKGQYELPDDERQRVMNILERAINVEKGISKGAADPNLKVTAEGVDVSMVGKVDEKELLKKLSPKRIVKDSKVTDSSSSKESAKAKPSATKSGRSSAATSATAAVKTTTTKTSTPMASKTKSSAQKQPPVVVAHKRSPSSPAATSLTKSTAGLANSSVNPMLVRATKSKPQPVLKTGQKSSPEAINTPAVPVKPTPSTPSQRKAAKRKPTATESKTPADKASGKRPRTTPKPVITPTAENGRESRASQRVRLQYQPFQSPEPLPVIPTALLCQPSTSSAAKASKSVDSKDGDEEKVVIYDKDEFLAVRNETNDFYICRAKQNIYKKGHNIKILWFNNDKQPKTNIYTADFYDTTDFECILTNVTMDSLDKGQYQLPDDERQRILNILQRAINVEKGISKGLSDPNLKVTADGVDVSMVGKLDENELLDKISPKPSVKPMKVSVNGVAADDSEESSKVAKSSSASKSGRISAAGSSSAVSTSKRKALPVPVSPSTASTRQSKRGRNQSNVKS